MIKDDIIFHTDTGSNEDILKDRVLKDGYNIYEIDAKLSELYKNGTLTIGKISKFVVVSEWMPNKAEKLRNEGK